jgi:hypothetical protein
MSKYDDIKVIMNAPPPKKGFRSKYMGPSTPGHGTGQPHPMYHVLPLLMGTNAAGEQKVLGYKYNGCPNGDGWHCFLVDCFDGPIVQSNAPPPAVGPVDESRQCCIKNIDHS